jgi:hypothetical protein
LHMKSPQRMHEPCELQRVIAVLLEHHAYFIELPSRFPVPWASW